MYEEVKATIKQEPEHLKMASDMANTMISQFSATQQNEMISTIKNIVINQRKECIENLSKELSYLNDMLNNLIA